jgi:kinetochore protein Spc25
MTNIHVRRPLQINLHALLQQQVPTIDLGVQSYENSTHNFLEAVTKYKNRAITTLSERRRHQAQEKKKILDKTSTVETESSRCKLREIELVARMLSLSSHTMDTFDDLHE